MKLNEYIKQYQSINGLVDKLDAILKRYNTDSMGLIPDNIRLSPEYIKDNNSFKLAFKAMQDFNRATKKEAKQFRKQYGNYASIMSIKVDNETISK